LLFYFTTAIQNGSDITTIEYLLNRSPVSLFHRNLLGKTPLHLAVEYACSTVVSTRKDNGSRSVVQGGHPQQISHDKNSLRTVEVLFREYPHALTIEDFSQGTAPLHALITHTGPGRQETLRTIVESTEASEISINQYESSTSYQCNDLALIEGMQQQRRLDRMTPLLLACVAEHYFKELVQTLARFFPSSIAVGNIVGMTPLHLLCNLTPSKEYTRMRLSECQDEITQLIVELAWMCPRALKMRDAGNRLPLHLYLECPLISPKRPEVLMTMLELYPESAWAEHPTLGSIAGMVTSHALLSSKNLDISLAFNHGKQERVSEEKMNPEEQEPVIDPNLLCLTVILNHWHMHDFGTEHARRSASDALTAVRLFMHLTPVYVLQERVCGNSLRCTLRLIVAALFQAEYRQSLVHYDPETQTVNAFMKQLVPELQAMYVSRDLESLSERVKFFLRNDLCIVTMSVLLPSFQRDLFFTMFPTFTPEWFAGGEDPVFLAFGLIKWCKDRNVSNYFNLALASEALQLPPRESMLLSARRTVEFFQANSSKFDTLVVQNIGGFAQSVIEDEDCNEWLEDSPEMQHAAPGA
jgi:hypothetical protein